MKNKISKITLEKAYEIIKKPITTEKSTNLQQFNQYSFIVSKQSNSMQISKAIEMIFKVKVRKVNTAILRGKGKTFKGQFGFRKDIKTFGRKAIVKYTSSIEDDARRRDFTFNAIYLNMKGEILDPLGNFSDLVNGKVRFVGQPKKRIEEDHLRILRFFRFISKYPSQNRSINLKTLAAIKQSKYLLKKLSKDRIWKEFKLILSSDGVCLALRFMRETGVLNILFSSISLKNIGNLVELEKKNYFRIFR